MEEAQKIIDLGFVLGIGGVVTYKNSKELQQVVKNVPLESIVLETDAPYLPPTPFRGKRNESSYLTFIAEKIAELKEITMDEVGASTTATARKVFAR
jgi:TatD DNase family protein